MAQLFKNILAKVIFLQFTSCEEMKIANCRAIDAGKFKINFHMQIKCSAGSLK